MIKIIYFVHSRAIDNLEHKQTVWIPGELSKRGIEQNIILKEQININKNFWLNVEDISNLFNVDKSENCLTY